MMARQRSTSVICSSSDSHSFSQIAPGATETFSRERGNAGSSDDTRSLDSKGGSRPASTSGFQEQRLRNLARHDLPAVHRLSHMEVHRQAAERECLGGREV